MTVMLIISRGRKFSLQRDIQGGEKACIEISEKISIDSSQIFHRFSIERDVATTS